LKKLLFVAPSISYGGAEKNFIGIANYAVSVGYSVFLLTDEGHESMRYIDPRIVQIKVSIKKSDKFFIRYIFSIIAIRKIIYKIKADVVISFIEFWRSASILATRFSSVKCIVSERSDPYSRGRKHDNLVFFIFGLAEGHVFQTKMAQNYFNQKIRNKSCVIPNPVFDEDLLEPYSGRKEKIIVNIARLDLNQKRQDVLIKAFSLIANKYPEYSLYLYGGGADEDKIRQKILESGFKDRIYLMGVTRNLYDAIGSAEMLVLTSDFEGIPNVIIEGMSIGTPVISTKCSPGGAELLIKNGFNGLLVERNNPKQLAEAIISIIENPEKTKKMIENGFFIKDRFQKEDILNKWLDYIEKA